MISFRLKIGIAIICVVMLSLGVMNRVPALSCEPLSAAMETTGAKVEEFSVNSWVTLPSGQLTNTQLENIVGQVMSRLGIDSQNYQLVHQQKGKQRMVQAEVITKDFHAVVLSEVISDERNAAKSEGYLVVNIEAKSGEKQSIKQVQEKISGIIKDFGNDPQINTCLIGWLDGKLRDGEWHECLRSAFMTIDATIVDELRSENFASYTGYSPEIIGGLQVGNKKINLNMAIRYSPYDNRTYITVGSPIITREY